MRSTLLIGFGLALMTLQATLGTLLPMHTFAPNLMLPIAIFLGVSAEVNIVRGAALCFVLGYLLDSLCGSPVGLQTFVLVAAFFVARGAGVRLAPQGLAFQMLMTLMMALLTGGTILALRAIFEHPPPFETDDATRKSLTVLRSALVTALLSPPIFRAVRRIEGLFSRGEERAPST